MNKKSSIETGKFSKEKLELLELLLKEKGIQKSDPAIFPTRHTKKFPPLSFAQRRLWFLNQTIKNADQYHISIAFRLSGAYDHTAFEKSINAIIQRHEILRTNFHVKDGVPYQHIHSFTPLTIPVIDLQHLSDKEQTEKINTIGSEEMNHYFDLASDVLIRIVTVSLNPREHIIFLTVHHIVCDVWSLYLFIKEIKFFYSSFITGEILHHTDLPVQYADFSVWQTEQLSSTASQKQLEYWKKQLAGIPDRINLPTSGPRPTSPSYVGRKYYFTLNSEITQQIKALSIKMDCNLFHCLFGAFALLLSRYSGQTDIVIGTPVAGRNIKEAEQLIGCFINTLPVRFDLSAQTDFSTLILHARSVLLDALSNQEIPFEKLVEELHPERNTGHSPIFQVMFSFQNIKMEELVLPGLSIKRIPLENKTSKFDLTFGLEEKDTEIKGWIEYRSDLFTHTFIERIAGHYISILNAFAENQFQHINDVCMLSDSEKETILSEWNQTAVEYPSHLSVCGLIEEQVLRSPSGIAVRFENDLLSYSELDKRSNQLARCLRLKDIGRGKRVGVLMDPSPDLMVTLIGIMKSGAAYVPLDPYSPAERLKSIIADVNLSLLLANNQWEQLYSSFSCAVEPVELVLESCKSLSSESLTDKPGGKDLAYIIYTSGSTGRPKGVCIYHAAVVNFLLCMKRRLGITTNDVFLAITSISFDISVLEMFLPLVTGASVSVLRKKSSLDPLYIKERIIADRINFLQATPATWHMLIQSGWEGSKTLTALCGGEALSAKLAKELATRVGTLWNMYGPTETTVWSTMQHVTGTEQTIPIGKPIDNTEVFLLDSFFQPVPIGVPGNLYIGGEGLAEGYFNNSELTAERFIYQTLPGTTIKKRLYNTGDLACFRPDGVLEYIGRSDYQVKVQGYRIELEEIEALLESYPSVKKAVVTTQAMDTFGKKLIAYIIPGQPDTVSSKELFEYLKGKLPLYMLPSGFVFLEEFPLTYNGKINRGALPKFEADDHSRERIEPRNFVESALVEIWCQVLNVGKVGVYDNFFELGGTSLQSIEVVSLANDRGIYLTPALIFEHQTIAEVAEVADHSEIQYSRTIAPSNQQHFSITEDDTSADNKFSRNGIGIATLEANILIESMGMYLPPSSISSKQILAGCSTKFNFPFEEMTGIKERRMAGENEFSIDLAKKAVLNCLDKSQYEPNEIDLLICASISRADHEDSIGFEPGTSVKIKKDLGFTNALTFDISNACPGLFTAILIASAYLKSGVVSRAMVISGEYITNLTKTAQKEIKDYLDVRMACLTLGDSGIAMILERSYDKKLGFIDLDLFTLGGYSSFCIAKVTDQPHGGPIMYTESVKFSELGKTRSALHARSMMKRYGWKEEDFQHLILHQTSRMTIRNAMKELNQMYNKQVCTPENTVINITERGNTATTSHFVAIMDQIEKGKIGANDKILFGISGSGITLGTALYAFDDLPERLKNGRPLKEMKGVLPPLANRIWPCKPKTFRIAAVGLTTDNQSSPLNTVQQLTIAAQNCLQQAMFPKEDIDLIIYAGIYRDEFSVEPAVAAVLAGEMGINATLEDTNAKTTFTFDLFNGTVGFLSACYTAIQMMLVKKSSNPMIVAGEIENNKGTFSEDRIGLEETASAILIQADGNDESGFGNFMFNEQTDYLDAYHTSLKWPKGQSYLDIQITPELEDLYVECLIRTVNNYLQQEGLSAASVTRIFPPQISTGFIEKLSRSLPFDAGKYINALEGRKDLFTSSIPYTLQYVQENGLVKKGDTALILAVGSGLKTGCALYYF